MRDSEIVEKWLTDFGGKCIVLGGLVTACVLLLVYGLLHATTWDFGFVVFAIAALFGAIARRCLSELRESIAGITRHVEGKENQNTQG